MRRSPALGVWHRRHVFLLAPILVIFIVSFNDTRCSLPADLWSFAGITRLWKPQLARSRTPVAVAGRGSDIRVAGNGIPAAYAPPGPPRGAQRFSILLISPMIVPVWFWHCLYILFAPSN